MIQGRKSYPSDGGTQTKESRALPGSFISRSRSARGPNR
nr:MAG TPA: hypothetical protein [Caudoviricetes sp.]